MKRCLTLLLLLLLASFLNMEASAQSFTAPAVTGEAEALMPEETDAFGAGLLNMLEKLLPAASSALRHALRTALGVFACVFLVSLLQSAGCSSSMSELAGAVGIATLMLQSSRSLIGLAVDTVNELSAYSKLLFPVLAAASASQGSVTSSAALCAGTAVFTAVLTNLLRKLMIPAIYFFLAAAVAGCALGEDTLKSFRDQLKKLSAWFLKSALTLFLTYMTITGAVTGAADKTALKATKAAISAVVPVIGKNLADASEALLLSTELVKNALGLYGIFAFLAIFLSPFVKLGAHYLVTKGIAALCGILGSKRLTQLTEDFSAAMGLLLGMIGTMCALNMIAAVSFLKGAT